MKKSDLIKACEEHEQISEIKNIVMFSDFGITHNTADTRLLLATVKEPFQAEGKFITKARSINVIANYLKSNLGNDLSLLNWYHPLAPLCSRIQTIFGDASIQNFVSKILYDLQQSEVVYYNKLTKKEKLAISEVLSCLEYESYITDISCYGYTLQVLPDPTEWSVDGNPVHYPLVYRRDKSYYNIFDQYLGDFENDYLFQRHMVSLEGDLGCVEYMRSVCVSTLKSKFSIYLDSIFNEIDSIEIVVSDSLDEFKADIEHDFMQCLRLDDFPFFFTNSIIDDVVASEEEYLTNLYSIYKRKDI